MPVGLTAREWIYITYTNQTPCRSKIIYVYIFLGKNNIHVIKWHADMTLIKMFLLNLIRIW